MNKLSRTVLVVVSLLVGSTFGAMASGCALVWLGVAHAGSATPPAGVVVDVSCAGAVKGSDGKSYVVASFPGVAKEDLAANIFRLPTAADLQNLPNPAPTIAGVVYPSEVLSSAGFWVDDASVAVVCETGPRARQ